jgi:hypothetical protein
VIQQLSHRKVKLSKYSKVGLCVYRVVAKMRSSSTSCACKKDMLACIKGISQFSNEVRLEMWFDGESESFNAGYV